MYGYLDLPSAIVVFTTLVVTVALVLVHAVRVERKTDAGARAMARRMRR